MSNKPLAPGDVPPVKLLCLDPEVPDYPSKQAEQSMQDLRRDVMSAFDKFEAKGAFDVRCALALVMIHLADINNDVVAKRGSALHLGHPAPTKEQKVRWDQVDELAKRTAQAVFDCVDHNVRLQVRYKK
jgi:hypothetical protein